MDQETFDLISRIDEAEERCMDYTRIKIAALIDHIDKYLQHYTEELNKKFDI
jgi:hypothetical protein